LPSFRILPWLTALAFAASATNLPHDASAAEDPASASTPSAAPPAASAPAAPTPASQRLDDALRQISQKQFDVGLPALRAIIDAHSFASLSADDRHRALQAAGQAEMALQHWPLAKGYMARAAAMPQATAEDQLALMTIGAQLHDQATIVAALTALARQWPEHLGDIDDDYLTSTLRSAGTLPRGTALALLQAMYAANFKLKGDIEPSDSWRSLTLLLVEQGRVAEAVEVSARITDAQILVDMRADRRFDAVVAAHPERFDVAAAASREIRTLQAKDEAADNSLRVKTLLMAALMRRQHAAAALAIADEATAEISDTNYPERRYLDYLAEYGGLLSERAFALLDLGLWDEAVAQLTAAAREFEHDRDNVGAAIALAEVDCDLARPKDARSVLDQVASGLSPYGTMQLEGVKLDVATQEGDAAQVKRSLNYLAAHRSDAALTYLSALIIANELDRAAQELRRQLADPVTRQEALGVVQTYALEPATPRDLEMRARWQSVLARQDVQKAIDKVGRTETYDLEGALF
jgi:beta-barrel assembly-enhancing protease